MRRLEYKRGLVGLVFVLVLAMCVWLWFGEDFNQSRYVLKTADGLTIRGWLAFLASLFVLALSAPHMFNILTGKPLIEIHARDLRIWAFPHEAIPLGEIEKILVGDQVTEIHRYGAKPRKVRVGMSKYPRVFFFDEVKSRLPSSSVVEER